MKRFLALVIIASCVFSAKAWIKEEELLREQPIQFFTDSLHLAGITIESEAQIGQGKNNYLAWGYHFNKKACTGKLLYTSIAPGNEAGKLIAIKKPAPINNSNTASASGIMILGRDPYELIFHNKQMCAIRSLKVYYYVYGNGNSSLKGKMPYVGGSQTEEIRMVGNAEQHILTINPAIPTTNISVVGCEGDNVVSLPTTHPFCQSYAYDANIINEPVIFITDITVTYCVSGVGERYSKLYNLQDIIDGYENKTNGLKTELELTYARLSQSKADINGDGNLNATDVVEVYNKIINGDSKTYYSGVEYVDLGLPSKFCWAASNAGTKLPEAAGDYYAYNEKTDYSYYQSGKTTFTKDNYIPDDGNISYDYKLLSARMLSTGWKIPTLENWQELLNKEYTTQVYTTLNGVPGWKITSKINGNSIFLPMAGNVKSTGLIDVGTKGSYMTATCSSVTETGAYSISMTEYSIYDVYGPRYLGYSIRGICIPH